MRVAPPVQALSCGAGPWRFAQLLLYALAAFVFVYWGGARLLDGGLAVWLGSLASALAAAACAARGLLRPARLLIWDAAAWSVAAPGGSAQTGRVTLMLDFGSWMLVRFCPAAPSGGRWPPWPQWLPLSSRDAGGSWPALRVALHSLPSWAAEPAAPGGSLPAA
ncbi:MAG TPA: hypothetical protein VET87_05075 [Rubrivivax sp.]|nr:hypothetical protein [Rubrivivax sp.]